jgi:sulfite reductase (NADPH) hemoprotein beta-component
VPGYASVVLSLKKTGVPPGDATAEQMDFVADLADKLQLRRTARHPRAEPGAGRRRAVASCSRSGKLAKAQGLATPNIGLLTDIIACPGGDFCSLANAKSIPIAPPSPSASTTSTSSTTSATSN